MTSWNNYKRVRSLDYFFPSIPTNKRRKMELDEVASFSITKEDIARTMSELISKEYSRVFGVSNNITILDGMACVGGNTISFSNSNHFKKIIAIELDDIRFRMLAHNIHTVLNLNNVSICNENILNLSNDSSNNVRFEILFLDPEWGGPEYKSHNCLRLRISGTPIEDFCLTVFNQHKKLNMIALKLPLNYDCDMFESFEHSTYGIKYKKHILNKMMLVLLKRN